MTLYIVLILKRFTNMKKMKNELYKLENITKENIKNIKSNLIGYTLKYHKDELSARDYNIIVEYLLEYIKSKTFNRGLSMFGDYELVEDLFITIFTERILGALDKWKNENSNFMGWCITVMRNFMNNHYNSKPYRMMKNQLYITPEDTRLGYVNTYETIDGDNSMHHVKNTLPLSNSYEEQQEENMLNSEYEKKLTLLNASFNALNTAEDQIIRYRLIHNWSVKDICKELNISKYQYNKKLMDAKKKMRKYIESEINKTV